ncbi:glycosyltransferase family 4 protein [Capnocytophaga sputigena]|uniref:glycosyltransferase family 4 protein n=1 Tax=Capnocytophaga sputigena TaxID=1019 RepID=UPI0031F4AD84
MKKIAFLVHDIHFGGGGERVVANLSDIFIRKGYFVTIISLCKKKETFSFELNKKVHIDYLNTNSFKIEYFNKLKSLFCLRKYLNTHTFDFVLGIGTYLNILLALSNKRNIKTIGCEHNYFFSVSFFWIFLRKIFYRKLSAVVSLTEEDSMYLQKISKYIAIIPNPLSFKIEKNPLLTEKKIIALGRTSFQKGFDLMLEMFSEFCMVNNEWLLEIRGNGDKEELKRIVESFDIANRVKLLPATNDVISAYMNASIYLMTSRFEGLPMVLLEASECGLPMVAYDCKTGPSEIIKDGENGFLIPCYDKKMMVEKLNLLCNDFELRKTMGEKAKKMALRFDKDFVFSKWENLFNKLDQKNYDS